MRIIETIEVKHFRSFLGSPKKYETVVAHLTDLNVFSGANDSGKSNILRVLNLFFNDQISNGVPFDFERDFFIGKMDAGHKVVEISISFNLSGDEKRDKFLPEKFKISKFYDRSGFRNFLYSFSLKERAELGELVVDSRSENNDNFTSNFDKDINPDKPTKRREWVYRVKFSGFLNKSVAFEYVPAIRDKNFFSHLFGRVITTIKSNEDKALQDLLKEKNKIINWDKTIKNKTEKALFKENIQNDAWRQSRLSQIEQESRKEAKLASTIVSLEQEINKYSNSLISSISFIESEFKIGKNLQEFFEGFDVGTGDSKSISLSLRGDGVQAKFVPKILNFLSEVETEKKYFIWGFEEPENSAEYKNQQELARELKTIFATDKQIFVTTHSEEFLHLYDGGEIPTKDRRANLYHVKKIVHKEFGDYSQVFFFDVDKNEFTFVSAKSLLHEDLGQSYLRAKYSKELKEQELQFLKDKEALASEVAVLKKNLDENGKPILYVEDSYTELYKVAWLKLKNFPVNKTNVISQFDSQCPFQIVPAEGAQALAGFLRSRNVDIWHGRKIVGLFDFDETGVSQFKSLKNETYWKTDILGSKETGLFKRRVNHPCFVALLLPIPPELQALADLSFPSFIEIENFLPNDFLLNNFLADESVTTGHTKFIKIKESKKNKIWLHSLALEGIAFNHFARLFDTVSSLFNNVEVGNHST